MRDSQEITRLLGRHAAGDAGALDELLPIVYDELRKLARSQRRRLGGGSATLDTTALAHEAYLRLAKSDGEYAHRGHFYAVMAAAMRQLLVDEARRRSRQKRGGGERVLTLGDHDLAVDAQIETILVVDTALDRLAAIAPRLRSVVECRFYLGLDELETAAALGVTDRTVRRDWIKARAWLEVELGSATPPAST
ncbi:MAG: ECF-type sigma factor [Thermoanaerobaculia bacterium]